MIGLVNNIWVEFIQNRFGQDVLDSVLSQSTASQSSFINACPYSDSLTDKLVESLSSLIGINQETIQEEFGVYFVSYVLLNGYEKLLRCLGADFVSFCNSLNNLHLQLSLGTPAMMSPEFCVTDVTPTSLDLHYYSQRLSYWPWVIGILRAVGHQIFGIEVQVKLIASRKEGSSDHEVFRVIFNEGEGLYSRPISLSSIPTGSNSNSNSNSTALRKMANTKCHIIGIDPASFYDLCPFHILFDMDLKVIQVGRVLERLVPDLLERGALVNEVLDMRHPWTWDLKQLQRNGSSKIVLATKSGLEIKGGLSKIRQVVREGCLLSETTEEVMLFMGSPRPYSLDDLTSHDLYLSDFPHWDMAADFVLLAEQLREKAEAMTEELGEANNKLKDSLAKALACKDAEVASRSPYELNSMSPAGLAIKLLDSLMIGEEVDAEQVLAVRASLLNAGTGSMWQPVQTSGGGIRRAFGGDEEVSAALQMLLMDNNNARGIDYDDLVANGASRAVSPRASTSFSALDQVMQAQAQLHARFNQDAGDVERSSEEVKTLTLPLPRTLSASKQMNEAAAFPPGSSSLIRVSMDNRDSVERTLPASSPFSGFALEDTSGHGRSRSPPIPPAAEISESGQRSSEGTSLPRYEEHSGPIMPGAIKSKRRNSIVTFFSGAFASERGSSKPKGKKKDRRFSVMEKVKNLITGRSPSIELMRESSAPLPLPLPLPLPHPAPATALGPPPHPEHHLCTLCHGSGFLPTSPPHAPAAKDTELMRHATADSSHSSADKDKDTSTGASASPPPALSAPPAPTSQFSTRTASRPAQNLPYKSSSFHTTSYSSSADPEVAFQRINLYGGTRTKASLGSYLQIPNLTKISSGMTLNQMTSRTSEASSSHSSSRLGQLLVAGDVNSGPLPSKGVRWGTSSAGKGQGLGPLPFAIPEQGKASSSRLDFRSEAVASKPLPTPEQVMVLLSQPSDELTRSMSSSLDGWFYDSFKLNEVSNGRPLSSLAFFLFKRMGLISKFKLNETRLARFLLRIEDGYKKENPYHNRIHAADVLRTTHVFLTRGGVLKAVADAAVHQLSLPSNTAGMAKSSSGSHIVTSSSSNARESPMDHSSTHRDAVFKTKLLSCYISAVAHDHEHRGLTNDFLIRAGADLALLYNDMSPHEMHHVSSTSLLLNDEQYNFFPPVKNNALKDAVRRDLIDLVLATDMKQHFGLCGMFKTKVLNPLREHSAARPAPISKIKLTSDQASFAKAIISEQGSLTLPGHKALDSIGSLELGSVNEAAVNGTSPPVPIEGTPSSNGTNSPVAKSASPRHAHSPLSTGQAKIFKSGSSSQLSVTLNDTKGNSQPRPSSDAFSGVKAFGSFISPNGMQARGPSSGPIMSLIARPSTPMVHDWDTETQTLVLKVAIKCADLGHLTSTGETHRKWVSLLEEEMFRQGYKERAQGMPISPLMDRRKGGVTKSQTGFFNIVAVPLYEAFSEVFTETWEVYDNLMVNYRMWEEEEKAHAAAMAAKEG